MLMMVTDLTKIATRIPQQVTNDEQAKTFVKTNLNETLQLYDVKEEIIVATEENIIFPVSSFEAVHYYHPTTKLLDGNDLNCLCLSFCLWVPVQGPGQPLCTTSRPSVPLSLCTWSQPLRHVQTCSTWTSMYKDPPDQTCSNLFILDLTMFKFVTSQYTIYGKWAVGIRLKCLLF